MVATAGSRRRSGRFVRFVSSRNDHRTALFSPTRVLILIAVVLVVVGIVHASSSTSSREERSRRVLQCAGKSDTCRCLLRRHLRRRPARPGKTRPRRRHVAITDGQSLSLSLTLSLCVCVCVRARVRGRWIDSGRRFLYFFGKNILCTQFAIVVPK